MPDTDRLRLIALDTEDLSILSAHVQDAVLKPQDIRWLAAERRVVIAMTRFAWEESGKRGGHQRRRSALYFARVGAVKSTGIDRKATGAVLNLLAISFEPGNEPSGEIVLDFAGGAAMRLSVECVAVQLTDLGPAWSTQHAPRHSLT